MKGNKFSLNLRGGVLLNVTDKRFSVMSPSPKDLVQIVELNDWSRISRTTGTSLIPIKVTCIALYKYSFLHYLC